MKKSVFWLFLGALLFQACRNKGEATLGMRFVVNYQAQPLVLNTQQLYPATNGDSIEFQTLNFFVSEIKLINKKGKAITVFVDSVQYLDFNDVISVEKAQQGKVFTLNGVPADDYTEIRFGIGVQPSLNAKEPGDFSSSSPLGDLSHYWTAWDSYIFSRVEGRLHRSNGDEIAFLYHSGVDAMYQTRSLTKEFSLVDDQSSVLVFDLDAHQILFNTATPIDVVATPISHTAAEGSALFEIAKRSVMNLANGITVR